MRNLQLLDDGNSENICNKKISVLQKIKNRILKELIDGQFKPVISLFNKSQKAQKNPKY